MTFSINTFPEENLKPKITNLENVSTNHFQPLNWKGSQHITAEIILHFSAIKWNNLCKLLREYPESMVHMGTFG